MTRQIERLVESSYSNLAPSHHVEQELLSRLPPQRARPRLSLPLGIAAVILIGTTAALLKRGDEPPGATTDGDGAIELASVVRPESGVVPSAKDDVAVRLLFEGRIQVREDDMWVPVSLHGLGEHLGKAKRDQRVVVFADRNAPWQHVQWIMILCAERQMPKLAFAVLAKVEDGSVAASTQSGDVYYLDASLPTDPGIGAVPGGKRIQVWVRPHGGVQRTWDGRDVTIPTRADYSIGQAKIEDLARVTPRLAVAHESDPARRGEIKASARTPFRIVAELVAAFRRAGIEKLDFFGTAIPTRELRAGPALPYPGEPARKTGPTLRFGVEDGDREALAKTVAALRRRARAAGLSDALICHTDVGIEWTLLAGEDAKLATSLAERRGVSLEFHITVEKEDQVYAREWERRRKGDDPSPGFRWYELSDDAKENYSKARLPEGTHPLVLCRTDDSGISGASLEDVHASNPRGDWAITFQVREQDRQKMADLTAPRGSSLAIIVDGKVHSAPRLHERLRSSGQITGGFSESDARELAALLGSPALPVQLKMAER